MAQNITLMGASYSDVPQVVLPKTGGGSATFTDVSDTTATASDVLNSKYFYNASGEKIQGTATGGGTPAISVVDTADAAGGVVRTITALDISDTTAAAADVASGKYFYTADGTKTAGTGTGGGADCPTFTLVLSQDMTTVQSISCDKTFSECYNYRSGGTYYALVDLTIGSTELTVASTGNYANSTLMYNVEITGAGVADVQIQYTSSTLTAVVDPIPWRTSSDLSASTLTVTAPSGYYNSSASKTLTDANLVSGNIKSGVSIFGVTGSYAGGSNWTLLATQEYTINTTGTSATSVGNVTIKLSDIQESGAVIWVHIRDKAGKRSGYYYGSDTIFMRYNSNEYVGTKPTLSVGVNSSGAYTATTSSYGVYPNRMYQTSTNHYVEIYRRYNSNYGTLNGTFQVDIYKLSVPSGFTLFT